MKYIKREPGIGYIDSWLWLPKSHVSSVQIESTFTYVGRDNMPIEAWREEVHHYRVPRNYLRLSTLPKLPFRVYDTRVRSFPRVSFTSNVVLDAYEPDKDYQRRGSEALLAAHDGILCLRCGAGKTVVALHSAAQLGVPILITVTDESLYEQWLEEIEAFLGIDPKDVGYIGGGKFNWKKAITIAQVASLAKRANEDRLPPEMTHHFGVIISDEAHVMGAPHFNNAIPPFHGRRWGLSATPEREDGFDTLLRFTIGEVAYTYLTPDLKPDFLFHQLPTSLNFEDKLIFQNTHDKRGEFHYGMTYGFLARTNKDGRTDRIVRDIQDALASGRQVLVLAHSKEMTEILGAKFPNAGVVNGNVKGKERRRRIRECNPVVAIMTLGKQALNKPMLDTLFLVEPFAKKGMLQQTMGRVLRKYYGKKRPIVIVFEDVFVKQLSSLCGKIRFLLSRWPANKGGKIPYTTMKIGK
jgi:superfamily II DNA or RNA helicase